MSSEREQIVEALIEAGLDPDEAEATQAAAERIQNTGRAPGHVAKHGRK